MTFSLNKPSPFVAMQRNTTYRPKPKTGDFLLWIRCTEPFSAPPKFDIIDFWEFRDGDTLLITNREEDYPSPPEQMEEYDAPFLWKVVSGDRLSWVGWRVIAGEKKRFKALIACEEQAYVYGQPAELDMETLFSFGDPSFSEMTPEIRALWKAGFNAAVSLGVPDSWTPTQ